MKYLRGYNESLNYSEVCGYITDVFEFKKDVGFNIHFSKMAGDDVWAIVVNFRGFLISDISSELEHVESYLSGKVQSWAALFVGSPRKFYSDWREIEVGRKMVELAIIFQD